MAGKNRRICHSCRGLGKKKDLIEDLSRLFKNLAKIAKEEDVEILLHATIRKRIVPECGDTVEHMNREVGGGASGRVEGSGSGSASEEGAYEREVE